MTSLLRIAGRRCLLQQNLPIFTTKSLPITSDQKAIKEMQNYWDKNEVKLKRPMSPHLTIYKPQLTSMLSITFRMTGVGLSLGLIGVGWLNLYSTDFRYFADGTLDVVGPWGIYATKAVVVWGIVYHTLNGMRHLVWDRAIGLQINNVYKSGWSVLAASVVVALGLASL